MPAYNAEKYIKKAIESILDQTYTNFEFIIINDGSTDATLEIIKSFNDSRIVLIDNQTNMQMSSALNAGLKIVKGKYIARMDADDESLPTRFAKQILFLEKHSDIGVLGSAFFSLSPNNKKSLGKYPTSNRVCLQRLTQSPCFAHPTTMIRTLSLGNLRYIKDCDAAEDYKLWVDLAKQGVQFANLSEPLLYYRDHDFNTFNLNLVQQKLVVKKVQKEYAEYVLRGRVMKKFSETLTWLFSWQDTQQSMPLKQLSNFYNALDTKQSYLFSMVIKFAIRKKIDHITYQWSDNAHPKLVCLYYKYKFKKAFGIRNKSDKDATIKNQ